MKTHLRSRHHFTSPAIGALSRRRGSTILLVIAVLSLLVLLAVTLSFTSRLGVQSSANFAQAVQCDITTRTTMTRAAVKLAQELPDGALGPLDLAMNPEFQARRAEAQWLEEKAATQAAAQLASNRNGVQQASFSAPATSSGEATNRGALYLSPLWRTEAGEVLIQDAAARIDINAAPEEVLARFFELVGRESKKSVNGAAIARAIVEARLGPDGAPGEAGVDDDLDAEGAVLETEQPLTARSLSARETSSREPRRDYSEAELAARRDARQALTSGIDEADEYVSDLRLPAFGDDVRFVSLGALLQVSGAKAAGLNEVLLEAARPYLTPLSLSVDQTLTGAAAPLDLNRATAEEIVEGLRQLYILTPKNETLLRQFAVNVVDSRDTDRVPTVLGGGASQVLGLERTPLISEVYPDALTPDEEGDDGQFVEIMNPWNEPISVTGWHLRGAGVNVRLTGTIAAHGFLIVTDDPDNTQDEPDTHAANTGSLYHLFGVVANNSSRRILWEPDFELIHRGAGPATVTLEDADGNPVDQFTYIIPQGEEDRALYSYQRANPIVREALRRRPTPFSPSGVTPETAERGVLERLARAPIDAPFVDVTDVLEVFAGFAEERLRDGGEPRVERWAFPVVGTPASADSTVARAAAQETRLDGRLIDIFRVGGPALGIKDQEEAREALEQEDPERALLLARVQAQKKLARHPDAQQGRVNLNSAPRLVLASLPGVTEEAAHRLADRRQELWRRVTQGELEDGLLFQRPSDLLADSDLMAGATSDGDRLARLRGLLPAVAFNSRAFVLVGQPRVTPTSAGDQPAARKVETLVALDGAVPESLYWRPVR